MKYNNIFEGTFISRPNRFIAKVKTDGREETVHVKNTGRCKELLVSGAKVFLERSDNPDRKTEYDLVSVYKGDELINIDSTAPNKVFGEWLATTDLFGKITKIKPECFYKKSRFDYYIETENEKIFVEVKGVTLEKEGVVLFPDAPTERGVKHLRELLEATGEGFKAYAFFIVQMKNCTYFTPNSETHKEFSDTLREVREKGVGIYALNCRVTKDTLDIDDFLEVKIN